MTRSKKKLPITGIAGNSDKEDKRKANRKHRRITKESVNKDSEIIPEIREVSDVWGFNKDGKIYNKENQEEVKRK